MIWIATADNHNLRKSFHFWTRIWIIWNINLPLKSYKTISTNIALKKLNYIQTTKTVTVEIQPIYRARLLCLYSSVLWCHSQVLSLYFVTKYRLRTSTHKKKENVKPHLKPCLFVISNRGESGDRHFFDSFFCLSFKFCPN